MTQTTETTLVATSDRPWWVALIPDTRSWIVIGLFGLTFYVIHLLAGKDKLGDNKLFFALAMSIVSGGLGLAVGFYFGAAKKEQPAP